MLPMGEVKDAALVLMVEIFSATLTASNFGFEASSFFEAKGESSGVGQLLFSFGSNHLSSGDSFSRDRVFI